MTVSLKRGEIWTQEPYTQREHPREHEGRDRGEHLQAKKCLLPSPQKLGESHRVDSISVA